MTETNIKKLTFGGLMIALVFVTTFSVKIPVPFTQGYIHGGDSMIFLASILLGWKFGALAGGVGSALADFMGGYANWILPTLIIKTLMGALVGWIAQDLRNKERTSSSYLVIIGMAVIWFGSITFLSNKVGEYIKTNGANLLGQVDGASTIQELVLLTEKVQSQLFWASIVLPLLIIGLSIYFYKIDTKLFSVEQLLGMLIAGLWMVVGYYVAAGLMYGSFIVAIFSIPWNIVQFVIGLVIAYPLIIAIKKTPLAEHFE